MEGFPLGGLGFGGLLGGRANGFFYFEGGVLQSVNFSFRAASACALFAHARARATALFALWCLDLNCATSALFALWCLWPLWLWPLLPLGLRTLALLAAGGATRLGFVLVGSFILRTEVSLPLPPRPFPAVLETVFDLLFFRRAVRHVAVFSHFLRAQRNQNFHLCLISERGVGGVFRDV